MKRAWLLLLGIALAPVAHAGAPPAAAVDAVHAELSAACRCARGAARFRRCAKPITRGALRGGAEGAAERVRAILASACASPRCARGIVRAALRVGPPVPPPLPEPVEVASQPQGVDLGDPSFEPLPGARADFGRLGGAVYQIEVPDEWNGRLLLYMHGFEEFALTATVAPPDLRTWAILHGYAWGASSFSSTAWIAGTSADETAALWDFFARRYGRPCFTYVNGLSMGGAASHIAAERYPDRFDGSLAMCGSAGFTEGARGAADVFAAGAFVAGVTQEEFDAAPSPVSLIRDRIRPALQDATVHARFEDIVLDLTGGLRSFDRAGLHLEEETIWRRAGFQVGAQTAMNADTVYRLGPHSPVPTEQFQSEAIRLETDPVLFELFAAGNDATGEIAMPLLTLHTTGDGQVPVEQARVLRRLADEAGRGDRLVQRIVRDAGHCGFATDEQERSFADLVGWVERGVKPLGHDVLVADLTTLGGEFETRPRPGTPEADAVPGAEDRVALSGDLTLDGAPFDARFLGAIVRRADGLVAPCQYELTSVEDGHYAITVLGDTEVNGCGAPGAEILLWTFAGNRQLWSLGATPWPGDGGTATFDAAFSGSSPEGAAPPTVDFVGEVFRRNGERVPHGTRVEALVGRTLCGVASTRRTGSFGGYVLTVVGPDSVPGCALGAELTFRVGGERARTTTVNSPDAGSTLDLLLPRR